MKVQFSIAGDAIKGALEQLNNICINLVDASQALPSLSGDGSFYHRVVADLVQVDVDVLNRRVLLKGEKGFATFDASQCTHFVFGLPVRPWREVFDLDADWHGTMAFLEARYDDYRKKAKRSGNVALVEECERAFNLGCRDLTATRA